MAGVHVNELSSMEAAIRLKAALVGWLACGSVSVIPVVNQPALWHRTPFNCPLDDRNINFSFPGRPDGSFSEVLAHALLHDWSTGADVLIDLHGGDVFENVARFTMCQLTGDPAFDARTRQFAGCFDTELEVEFPKDEARNIGRACNAAPWLGRHAVMAEGGRGGVVEEDAVRYHFEGVINVLVQLGLVNAPFVLPRRRRHRLSSFERVVSPTNARFEPLIDVGGYVGREEPVAVLTDLVGRRVAELRSPVAGFVVFRVTHSMVREGEWLMGIGPEAA